MRREGTRPITLPQLVRSTVAQQQVRAGTALEAALPDVYANDAAAAAGGIPLNGVYRSGDIYKVRIV